MSVVIERAGPSRASQGLVLVHGRGGGASDILGLGAALGIADLALAAPQHPDHSWWPTSFLAPADLMEPHVISGMAAIDAAIDDLASDGVPPDRVALAGFSQGGCLCLEYAARKGGITGVFGLSGALVGTSDAGGPQQTDLYGHGEKRFDYATALNGLPVVMELHAADPHIPLARARRSVDVFCDLGAKPELHVLPGPGHAIGSSGVAAMRAHFNSARPSGHLP